MTAGTTASIATDRARNRWYTPTPKERARQRCPRSELLVIDHAGQLTIQLEQAQTMLAIAVDLLAAITGKERGFVIWTLEQAANVEMGA